MRRRLFFIGLVTLGIVVGIFATLTYQNISGPKQIVNITGQGVVEAQADQANINVMVQNTSWSQQQAQDDNKKEVQDLKDKLTALGIPDSRITISSYPAPVPYMGGQMPARFPTLTPAATTNLMIILDSLTGIDKVLSAIGSFPDAKITNTSYSLKSTSAYDSQAREKALLDARSQVESIAKINHLHVGKLISLNAASSGGPLPMYRNGIGGMGAANMPSVATSPVRYGEKTMEITATFNVQYELY